MEIQNMTSIMSDEINDHIEQIKEDLNIFFQYPEDHSLLNLISSELIDIELNANLLGLNDLYYAIRQLHKHLDLLNYNMTTIESFSEVDYQNDFKNIETLLTHYRLVG